MPTPERHRKIISFCLFGDNPLYYEGALENLQRAPLIYPGWECVFFVGESVPSAAVGELQAYGAQIHPMKEEFASERDRFIQAMFWRLLALDFPEASYLVFRDCDSRLGWKEQAAVNAWLASGRSFHFMYDHPYHSVPILGGMWGCRGGIISNISAKIPAFHDSRATETGYGACCDQTFLLENIWDAYVTPGSYLAHGELCNCEFHIQQGIAIEPFPPFELPHNATFPEPVFVGQVVPTANGRTKSPKV